MKPTYRTLCITALALAAAAPVFAAEPNPDMKAAIEARFQQLDANGDGYISKEEAAKMKGLPERFDTADANHDGKLDKAEFAKAMGA